MDLDLEKVHGQLCSHFCMDSLTKMSNGHSTHWDAPFKEFICSLVFEYFCDLRFCLSKDVDRKEIKKMIDPFYIELANRSNNQLDFLLRRHKENYLRKS